MANQVINVSGEDTVVREDTAKAYRGTYWALISVAAFVLIAALLFFGGFLGMLSGGSANPASGPKQENVGR
jgi:hypothetical protein